jgi:xanthine dehydrogenase/oxidase
MMVTETMIDHVAKTLNIPAEKLREINFYKQGDITHFGQVLDQGDRIEKLWNAVLKCSDYEKRLAEIQQFNKSNKYRKRGISIIPTKFGIAFTATFLNQGGALVHIYTDGSVLISHGGIEMGQGVHTKVAAIAATALNIPIEKVYISETSTDKVPNSSATAASMGSDLYGGAVYDACRQLNERLEPYRKKLGEKASFTDIVKAAYFDRVNLSAQGFYKTPNIGYEFEKTGMGKGRPFGYFTFGTACSEVEIDTLTGDFRVIRSDIVMDVGDSLNPYIDIGQIEGAFIQGLGLFMIEEMVWGDHKKRFTWIKPGHLKSKGPGMYKIPSIGDVPLDFRVHLLPNAPNAFAIMRSKAIGEPPLFLGSSVFYATKQAIYASREENGVKGYFVLDTPGSCERIRMACVDEIVKKIVNENYRPYGSY